MTHPRAAVVFDLYGTIVDLEIDEQSASRWNDIASQFFVNRGDVTGEALRTSYFELCDTVSRLEGESFSLDSVFAELLARFGAEVSDEPVRAFAKVFRRNTTVHLAKKDYTDALLSDIRASGYKVGLISNTEALLTEHDLLVLELAHAFDHTILSSGVGIKKPDTRIFGDMLARLGVMPAAATYIGDDFDADVLGAVRSDMDAIYLTSRYEEFRLDFNSRQVICANFTLRDIRDALRTLGFVLVSQSD